MWSAFAASVTLGTVMLSETQQVSKAVACTTPFPEVTQPGMSLGSVSPDSGLAIVKLGQVGMESDGY